MFSRHILYPCWSLLKLSNQILLSSVLKPAFNIRLILCGLTFLIMSPAILILSLHISYPHKIRNQLFAEHLTLVVTYLSINWSLLFQYCVPSFFFFFYLCLWFYL